MAVIQKQLFVLLLTVLVGTMASLQTPGNHRRSPDGCFAANGAGEATVSSKPSSVVPGLQALVEDSSVITDEEDSFISDPIDCEVGHIRNFFRPFVGGDSTCKNTPKPAHPIEIFALAPKQGPPAPAV